MDVDEPAHLEMVADDFKEGEHDRLDDFIKEEYPFLTDLTPENLDTMAPHILRAIVDQSGDRFLPKNLPECKAFLDSYPDIRNMIFNGSKKGYRDVRLLKILRPPAHKKKSDSATDLRCAAELGWENEYVGDAALALWEHVRSWFKTNPPGKGRKYYAKYSAIVQSSGMGKSRVVDEMSRSHFVIPINLRQPGSIGYPPSDEQAYNYLVKTESQRDAFIRSCSFLHALFLQTADVVKDLQGGSTAEEFRDYMTKGMEFGDHGENRTKFYEAVETNAKSLYPQYSNYFVHSNEQISPSHDKMDRLLLQKGFPLRAPFQTLSKTIEAAHRNRSVGVESPLKRQKTDTTSQSPDRPIVVLAFDEVHTLTGPTSTDASTWSRFGEIRRAIRGLRNESLFTLFLSTSGTLFSVTPTPSRDISARVISIGDVMLPFYELGFDQLAVRVKFSEPVYLSQVTSEEHLASYGRPLWRSYYENQESWIIDFAASKLLGGVDDQSQTLSDEQKLACLSQRIPIEFLSSTYSSQITHEEKEQVNSHMRVILKVDDGLENMVTVSPSEPVLSEAASLIMRTNPSFKLPQTLQATIKLAVHKGELGELLVALLFTIARDVAVGSTGDLNTKRWCGITELLQSLFSTPESASENHVDVTASYGWHFSPDGTKPLTSTLADTFKDSKVYFNHFIKVHQHAVAGAEFLMRLMVRGAAILCGNGQPGIDGIIPFLLQGDEIKLDNIGVIMFQVKNDRTYTDTQKVHRVLKMDPHGLKISAGIPIIRLFFALAANTPTLQLVHHDSSYITQDSYSAYDFWVSGLSSDLLVPVVKGEEAWDSILNASLRWEQIYSGSSTFSQQLRKSMNPGTAVGNEFWRNWCDVPQ